MAPKMTLMGKFKGIAEDSSVKSPQRNKQPKDLQPDQIEMHGIQKY